MRGEVVNMDRFRAPDASDEIARCQSCGERFHYTQMDEHGFCPTCQPDEDEDNDMTEKEMRELDAWIAEHVLGATWFRSKSKSELVMNGYCVFQITKSDLSAIGYPKPMFSPTTDPAAALQVLEKCLEKVSTASIEMYQGVDEAPEYNRVWCISLLKDSEVVIADTLPLAICLFARKLYETKT